MASPIPSHLKAEIQLLKKDPTHDRTWYDAAYDVISRVAANAEVRKWAIKQGINLGRYLLGL